MYSYRFTSTVKDLLDAEDADMTASTVRGWMRLAVSLIGLMMIVAGTHNLLLFKHPLQALPPLLAGSLLVYYLFLRSFLRRRHIRRENAREQELALEFRDDCLQIKTGSQGNFRREWSELIDAKDAARGILLYFDDGTVNWLPNRVFKDKAEKAALMQFLQSHEESDINS